MTVNVSDTNVIVPPVQDKIENNIPQQKADTNTTKTQEVKKSEETQDDPNWKAFREARKQDRAQREAAERKAMEKEAEVAALKAAMEAAFSKSGPINPQQQYYQQESYVKEETEDERIEKKVQAAIAAREAAAEKERAAREQQEYPNRLAQTYSDFHQTISQDNLDYLDYHYPEVSRPLQRLQNDYNKWSDIYLAIKKFVPNHSTSKKEAAKADNNFNKPRSMSSTSITQPGEALGSARLTDERRAANWQRMQNILKGVG